MVMAGHGHIVDDDPVGSSLSQRPFLALWFSQLFSALGDKLLHINAIGFALAAGAAAGSAMAQVLLWATLPALLVGLVAGVLVDRARRRQVMIASDLVRAGLLGCLPLAAGVGFWAVCGVIALVASAACFFGPARTALIPQVVSREQLVAANAWFAAAGFMTALVGTALGGWLLVWLGLKASLWVNAAAFGLSALVIALAGIREGERVASAPLSFAGARRELRAGLALIRRHATVRAFVVHYVLLMAIAAAVYVGLVGHAGREAAVGLSGMSVLLTAAVIGMIAGGITVHLLDPRLPSATLISVALAAIGCGAWGMAHSASVAALAAWLLAVGAGGAIYAAVIEASLQRIVPDALRGRVLAARGVVSAMAVIMVSLVAGPLADRVGKAVLFGGVAIAALVVSGVVWASGRQWLYWSVRWFFRQLCFAYFRLDVRGLEHIPATGGLLIAGNHPNVLDGLLLLVVSPRPVRFLVAEKMYQHRYLHGLFKGLGCIPVSRTKTHNGDALRSAVAALERGEAIGIFPEGTTTYRGSMEQIKRGVGLLALRTGVPVVPLGIGGSFEAFPKGTTVPRPRRICLRFDPAIRFARTEADPIPQDTLAGTLETIRKTVLQTLRRVDPAGLSTTPAWVKELQVAVSALVVLPLSSFLTLTAHPSLDPVERG